MLLLSVDTSLDKASFCISNDHKILWFEENEKRNEQAGWLHNALQNALNNTEISLEKLEAVAVSNGPGSYTGLRVGLSTAKGLCYALNIPLICINTLEILAKSVQHEAIELICPMIDARRMEVFTAIYDKNLQLVREPFATILDENGFAEMPQGPSILFTGNGSAKLNPALMASPRLEVREKKIDSKDMIPLAEKYFSEKMFQNVAYSEPYYVKDVYISAKK